MKTKNLSAAHRGLSSEATDMPRRTAVSISGRTSVIASIVIFIICYAFGIATYGVLPGMAIGWLPSAVVAWLSAHAIYDLSQVTLRALSAFKKTS